MGLLHFTEKDPSKGYINNQLLIPKGIINKRATRDALTFFVGEEEVIDPELGSLGMKPKSVKLWDETSHHMVVPRAYLDEATRAKFSKVHGVEWVEEIFESEELSLRDTIVPRDTAQEEAIEAMFKHRGGTLNLACGRGKTVVALKYWAMLRRPALVVVNTSALADQWMRKIRFFLGQDTEIGYIGEGSCTWKGCPIVVASVRSLANKRNEWSMEFRRNFGVVFFDEGHHMAAPHFVKAADLFFGQRFSLTATAFRTDGLEAISMYHIGGIIYQALEQDLIPDTIFHVLNWRATKEENEACRDVSNKVHHRKLCIMLGANATRNQIILSKIKEDMDEGRQILVLTHSVEHTRILGGMLKKLWKGTGIVNGQDTEPFDRIPILESSNPVVGTFDLAREALDKSELDTLHIGTPFGNSNDQQQSWGRIQRHEPTKLHPRVRVYEDVITIPDDPKKTKKRKGITMSADQCRMLRVYLQALKYPFKRKVEDME